MPQLSAFTPCGMLRMSSRPSYGQVFYEQLQQLLHASAQAAGIQFDFTVGGHLEAWTYAYAMGLGRHAHMLEHATEPTCLDLLPLHELDYLLTPGPKDDYVARLAALAAAKLLTQGYRLANVVASLKTLLGPAFLTFIPAPARTAYPASPGAGPGAFQDVRVPPRFLQLVDPVATTGSSWCAYHNLDTTISPMALATGDVVVVGAGNTSQQEQVTVTGVAFAPPAGSNATANQAPTGSQTWSAGETIAVGQYATPTTANATGFWYRSTTAGTTGGTEPAWPTQFGVQVLDGGVNWIAAGASTVFQATFAKSHDVGAPVVAGNWPYWWSTQRQSYVVLTAAAAADASTRAKVDAFMAKIARGVSTWAIVAGTPTAGTSGGAVAEVSAGNGIGTAPLSAINYTNAA